MSKDSTTSPHQASASDTSPHQIDQDALDRLTASIHPPLPPPRPVSRPVTITSAEQMIRYGMVLAKQLTVPAVIELIGDVGAGKTTLTQGLAKGFGVMERVTSPSFTISKRYDFADTEHPQSDLANHGVLVHYDFYRLPDPGLMQADLAESLSAPDTVTVVEWADSVGSLLPPHRLQVYIQLNSDGSRTVTTKRL